MNGQRTADPSGAAAGGTGHIYLVAGPAELAERRRRLPRGTLVETWPDLYVPGEFWIGEEAKRLLDTAGPPITPKLSVNAARVRIYYGPRLDHIDSLPREESLRARVLSGHGIAVAWVTLGPGGERSDYEPGSAADPTFFLRRPRGATAHLWRLFRSKREATSYMREHFGQDPEAQEWAESLPVESYEELVDRAAGG